MRKIIISLLLVLSLLFSSCASIRVNGVDLSDKKSIEGIDTNDVIAWTVLITTCSILYIGVPIVITSNLKQY